jgi:DNA-binding protein
MNIDYLSKKSSLRHQLLKSNENINNNNNDDLFNYYDIIIKVRHNILHYLVLDYMGMKWVDETSIANRIRELFGIADDNIILQKTPDIMLINNGILYLIDVSISLDIHQNEYNKKIKYQPICDYLNIIYKINTIFIHINLQSSLGNAEREIQKIFFINNEFDYLFLNECMAIVEDKINWISKFIDKTFFEIKKQEKYGNTFSTQPIGKYSDIDIDFDFFKKFNDGFDHIKKIINPIENFNEDDFTIFLKKEIEDRDGELYKKYKDNELNSNQFHLAKDEIYDDNKRRRKQTPKPTHHIIIPPYEKNDSLPIITGLNSEQIMIDNFFTMILEKDLENPTSLNNSVEKYNFIVEFSKFYKKMYDTTDKNINVYKCIFNNNDYSYIDIKNNLVNTRKIFSDWKAKCEFEFLNKQYDKKKKLKTNLLVEDYLLLNLSKKSKKTLGFNKHNKSDFNKIISEIIINEPFNLNYDDYISNLSYFDYLIKCGILDDNKIEYSHPYKQKTFVINFKHTTESFKTQWAKTGINQSKNNPDSKKWDVHDSIEFDSKENVSKMIEHLCLKCETESNDLEIFENVFSNDSPDSQKMKEYMKDQYNPYLKYLHECNAYNYLKKSNLIMSQLLHFTTLNLKPHTFSVFNSGIPNMICIVAGCYNNLFSELGKPFMFVVITKNPDYYTDFFGKVNKIKYLDNQYLIISNWRRLPTFKLTHMRDSYYSVLSSTMNSLMSCTTKEAYFDTYKYKKIFSLRAIISLCSNQKISELLMDNRYAYMSSFSLYTNINKLLVEKFGPPYRCSFECWIVDKILTKLPIISKAALSGKIKFEKPIIIDGKRDSLSMGGDLNIPSLWGDYSLNDVHEIMDEAFVYVHTLKEPSSTYHEEVNALKTICQFQEEYDNLNEKYKFGSFFTNEDIKQYLLAKTKIGFCSPIIYNSTQYTINEEKPNFNKIVDLINDESISELISTKAVIKDLDREISEDKKYTKREIKKYIEKLKKYKKDNNQELTPTELEELESLKKMYLKTNSEYYGEYKPRQKVFETILELLNNNSKIDRTVLLANDYVVNDNGRLVADICIKSQYGSKREFYVINIGAKAIARCTENFFRKLSENSPHEAISIPGDKKTLEMQKMLDRVYQNLPFEEEYNICFVNGDCTKWSAAETMGSFITMVYSLKEKIPKKIYELLLATFNIWSNKSIQIPINIINKVVFPKKDKAENDTLNFLHDHIIKNNGTIHSTQNFLQGMFNYSSSFKAVCCTNYTCYIWKKIYPVSKLYIEHMEHSDDYVVIAVYTNIDEFIRFRILHKIMMRLHGYNDSDRKTNCQLIFMEFVSQMSFNGVMLYPQIKKSKEINTNLQCTGYKTDMESALSRVGECMRVGCNQSFLYFFQRLHVKCVAEAYSLLPGMYNSRTDTYKVLFNTPIEMFGLPDPLPLFSLYCRGNGNNYRLYNYTSLEIKLKIIMLYELALDNKQKENTIYEDHDYCYSLFNPKFMYESKSKALIKIRRKLNISSEQLNEFWENHASYRFIKPRVSEHLITWLKAMFFNRTFVEAYTKSTRTKMAMRLSNFVKDNILKIYLTTEDLFKKPINMITIREMKDFFIEVFDKNVNNYQEKLNMNELEYNNRILKIITKCDPTYSAIYSLLNNIRINTETTYKKTRTIQFSVKTPNKIRSFDLVNSPAILLQYIYNKDDFIMDKRRFKSELSLDKDVNNVLKRLPDNVIKSKNPMDILAVYNDMSISTEKRIIMMGYNRNTNQLVNSVCDVLKYNLIPQRICDVHLHEIVSVIDPFTNDLLYMRGNKLTPDLYQQILENVTLLFVYMFVKLGLQKKYIREYFDNILFIVDDRKGKKSMILRDVLRKFTLSYFEQYNVDLNTKKIAAYLIATLYGDTSLINDLVTNIYNYTYRFIKRSTYTMGEYRGETVLCFTHMHSTQKVILSTKNQKKPIIIYHNDFNSRAVIIHYNIALRILGLLSDDEYVITMYKNRLNQEVQDLFETKDDFNVFIRQNNILGFVKIINEKLTTLPISQYNYPEEHVPIFVCKYPIYRGSDIKNKDDLVIPNINDNKLGVFVGKEKIYTLPFWKCKQYDNIVDNNLLLDNMSLKSIFEYRLLQQYFENNLQYTSSYNYSSNLDKDLNNYRYYINENRLYNFKFNNIYSYLKKIYFINDQDIYHFENLIGIYKEKDLVNLPVQIEQKYQLENIDILYKEKLIINDQQNEEPNIKIEEIINIDQYLKTDFNKMFDNINMDEFNDFPELNNQYDFDPGFLEDEDDILVYKPPNLTLNKDDLEQLNMNFSASDIFVEKPFSRKYKNTNIHTFSKQNFMLNRLKHMPLLSVCYTMLKYLSTQKYKITNIFDYTNTIGYLISKYKEIKDNGNIELLNIIYTHIYKFFTNVYISITPDDDMYYILENGEVQFVLIVKQSKYNDDTIKQAILSKNYVKHRILNNILYVDLKIDTEKIFTRYTQENGTSIVNLVNKEYESKIRTKNIKEINIEDLF